MTTRSYAQPLVTPSPSTPDGRLPPQYSLARWVRILIVFAILGPPAGGLVFAAPMLASSMTSAIADGERAGELFALPQLVGMIALFSFPFGGPPAVLAGLLLTWRASHRGRPPGYLEAAFVGAAISCAIIVAFFLVESAGRQGSAELASMGGTFAVVGAAAAVACTALCRWWGLYPQAR